MNKRTYERAKEEKTHTIIFWVDKERAFEVYEEFCDIAKKHGSHIKFDCVAPFSIKLGYDTSEQTITEKT